MNPSAFNTGSADFPIQIIIYEEAVMPKSKQFGNLHSSFYIADFLF